MRPDVYIHVHALRLQTVDTGGQSITVVAGSEISTVLSPHVSQPQLHFHFGNGSQELGQMPKVECSLKAKGEVGGGAVHLYDEQLPVIRRSFGASEKRRIITEKAYRYIKNDAPHHLQLRPRDTIKRLQLLQNRRSHKQRLWEPKRILRIKNPSRLIKDLPINPQQRRIQRPVPLQLHSKRSRSHQSKLINTVSNLPRQSEEGAMWRHLADEFASGLVVVVESQ